ncbi:MAG: hypothetical protein JRE24_06715 [Deltaproteobacteria bacterium]|nr:hypothetical protein [Deltaproteobacteria bacterium]
MPWLQQGMPPDSYLYRFKTEHIQENRRASSHLKKVDQGSGPGAGRRRSGAYTVVCEHFEPTRNTAMGT